MNSQILVDSLKRAEARIKELEEEHKEHVKCIGISVAELIKQKDRRIEQLEEELHNCRRGLKE